MLKQTHNTFCKPTTVQLTRLEAAEGKMLFDVYVVIKQSVNNLGWKRRQQCLCYFISFNAHDCYFAFGSLEPVLGRPLIQLSTVAIVSGDRK